MDIIRLTEAKWEEVYLVWQLEDMLGRKVRVKAGRKTTK